MLRSTMNVTRSGSVRRPRSSFATRPTATRSRDSSSASASASVIRSPSSAFSRIAVVAVAQRSPSDRRLRGDEAELGHLVELAGVVRELEERVAARRARAARSGSGASRSSGRGSRAGSRSARRPRTRASPGRRARRGRTRRARPRARSGRGAAARARPRPRTPSAGRCARATAGRGRGAASDPRTPTSAPRRRSAASRRRPRRAARARASGRSTFVSTTDVADSGVTATVRIRSSGVEETSWIESTAPSEETHSRGRSSSESAWRAYSIEEIGAVSSSPATSSRLRSVGTPTTSSYSASTRKKTGAMLAYEMRPSRISRHATRPFRRPVSIWAAWRFGLPTSRPMPSRLAGKT